MTQTRGWARRTLRMLGWLAGLLLGVVLVAATWAWIQLGRSLPQVDGTRVLAGLSGEVTVARDALGVPTVAGGSRVDVARVLGLLHGQDRFFQMDLARRRAAGELSELFGRAALPSDRASRLHRFRHRAGAVLAATPPVDRARLEAYAAGVNAGLQSLGASPFEYLLLRKTPAPWTPEDSVLVVAAMFLTLQDPVAGGERRTALLHEAFPAELADFLNSTFSQWDTPMQGARMAPLAVPGPDVFDLRTAPAPPRPGAARSVSGPDAFALAMGITPPGEDTPGSNNWVVAGTRTADGRALLSDDMHLSLSVPNIWYRASLEWRDDRGAHTVTGVTLPGVPMIIVGSNGRVAWGFTNTQGDWSDRVVIDPVPGDPSRYLTPAGPKAFEVFRERIMVAGEADDWLDVQETIWGPVAGQSPGGRAQAIVWVAHSPEGLNFRASGMETAESLDEAMTVANRSGAPAQNCVLADDQGHIGWTVAGRIPKRVGLDGRLPVSWADGSRKWDGFYEPADYPRIVNPESGVIVTANNRVVSDQYLEMLGDGGYDTGARARQILDGVTAASPATEAAMLAVQLDDRALMMDRWRTLALRAVGASPSGPRAEFQRVVNDTWTGRASATSAGYRIVRQFRLKVAELVFAPFVERLRRIDPAHPATPGRGLEGPVWTLATAQPAHLLSPAYQSWDALLVDAIDKTIADLTTGGRSLQDRTWGEANTLLIQHPVSRAVPMLARWIDMPREPLSGDSHMPRVQAASFGASQRLTVSPGHEVDGYFHMATGQSGHPRSAHYRDGHDAWVRGTATPFLPGPAVNVLVLRPR